LSSQPQLRHHQLNLKWDIVSLASVRMSSTRPRIGGW